MKYIPLEDRCLIRTIKKNELTITDSGIIIPDTSKKDVSEGFVVEAGPGKYATETGVFIPCMLKKGDKVLYGSGQGLEIEIVTDGVKEVVKVMREGDCLMIVEEK